MTRKSGTSRQRQLLDWFPLYVSRFRGSDKYRALRDYQQAWYTNLLLASWTSERPGFGPGYLPDDGQLWRLANARTERFFREECEPVLGMFEREGPTTDGTIWIYNRNLLDVLLEQAQKFHKKTQKYSKSTKDELTSYLDFDPVPKKEIGPRAARCTRSRGERSGVTCWGCYAASYDQNCG